MLGIGIAAAGLSSLSIPMSGVSGLVVVVIAGMFALMGVSEDMGQTCRTDSITA